MSGKEYLSSKAMVGSRVSICCRRDLSDARLIDIASLDIELDEELDWLEEELEEELDSPDWLLDDESVDNVEDVFDTMESEPPARALSDGTSSPRTAATSLS